MSNQTLDNLVKIKKLNREPPDANEFSGMVLSFSLISWAA